MNDERSGFGVMKYKSGDKYEGAWLANERHGPGKHTFVNKVILLATFVNGKLQGESTTKYPDGRELKSVWKDDKEQ